jgi:hypothetical protein
MIETNNKIIIDDMKIETNHFEEIKEDMDKPETSKKAAGGCRQCCYDCITCLLCANLCVSLCNGLLNLC